MPDDDDDDDFMPFEDWINLSEAEQQKIIDSEIRQWHEFWNSLTRKEQIKENIQRTLRSCTDYRRILKKEPNWEFMKKYHRTCQIRLLQLRIERQTGMKAGKA